MKTDQKRLTQSRGERRENHESWLKPKMVLPCFANIAALRENALLIQLFVTKYTPTQMITIPVMRVIERFSWKR
jgi:hypothetical protein